MDTEFGELLQEAGVETVIVDNDRKAHSTIVRDAWARFGIKDGQALESLATAR